MDYKRNCEIKAGMSFPDGMKRIALGVEYNGHGFNGFQRQKSAPRTVQGELEQALSYIADEPIHLVCAGRTDAGVHATGQVIHFDTLSDRPQKAWLHGTNTRLGDNVRVKWARDLGQTFHARFSATSRTYRYVLYSAQVRPATIYQQVTWTSYALELDKMNRAAKCLVGEHDFSSFRAAQCQAKTPVRKIDSLNVFKQGELIVIEVTATAFLHHMVRNIVGVLIDIGRGAKPVDWAGELLALKDRTQGAVTAHPFGLYLVHVAYPSTFDIPELPLGPLFITR